MRKRLFIIVLSGSLFMGVISHAATVGSLEQSLIRVASVDDQITDLIQKVSSVTNLPDGYLYEIYNLVGNKALYVDKIPNIYLDETVTSAPALMQLEGAKIQYREAPLEECNGVSRVMAYYLPDALYSVAYDISEIMHTRILADRGGFQVYYNSFVPEIKQRIAFYEAILLYTGTPEEVVANFQNVYERIITGKQAGENVVEVTPDGTVSIKSQYLTALADIGITDEVTTGYLSRLFANDSYLAETSDIEDVRSVFVLPYKPNYSSRENMMVAAACLVGRVRYVWGGGHSGATYIDGINPVWQKFNALYPTDPTQNGYGTCIKPSGSWCPVHGYTGAEYHGGVVYSLDDYVTNKAETLNASVLLSSKYRKMLEQVDYSRGINAHTLDGLDCSGFASWLVNQVTDQFNVNSTAAMFTQQSGIQPLEFGSALLPGDIYAWSTHIVTIVGRVSEANTAYVTVESTPNVLRYGVVYYSGASDADVSLARNLAREANQLIGNTYEEPHVYCMSTTGIRNIAQEDVRLFFPADGTIPEDQPQVPEEYIRVEELEDETGKTVIYITKEATQISTSGVGRPKVDFLDMGYENLLAQDILNRVLSKLTISYVAGYDTYQGTLLDKSLVATNLGGWE